MSVVTHRTNAYGSRPGKDRCTVCAGTVQVPYVEWIVANDDDAPLNGDLLLICSDCCRRLRRGLVPDLNKVVAFDDFRQFRCYGVPAH
jgi:hypothetical protein